MQIRRLVVFISAHCITSHDAVEIAQRVDGRYPDVTVEIFNIDERMPGPEIFAIPTYILDGRIVFLGNPTDQQVDDLLLRSGKTRKSPTSG